MDIKFFIAHAAGFWLSAGVAFVTLEMILALGIGWLFMGLAAASVGGLLALNMLVAQNIFLQLIVFLLLSCGWAVILWMPLKPFRQRKLQAGSRHMVGDAAIVESAVLTKKTTGKVKWSGKVMRARLHVTSPEKEVKKGEGVMIKGVQGNTLIVTAEEDHGEI